MSQKQVISAIIFAIAASQCVSSLEAGPEYQKQLTHRPRMSFDGRDTAHIARFVQRINTQEEPWASAYTGQVSKAKNGSWTDHRSSGWEGQSDKYAKLYSAETRNGELARAKAFVAWLYTTRGLNPGWSPLPRLNGQSSTDAWVRQQIEDAVQIINKMYKDWPCHRGFKVINRGIVAADSLALHCEAYDFLAALPKSWQPSKSQMKGAESRLADFASDLRFWAFTVSFQNTNHGIRVASGLGHAAIALNRYSGSKWWKPGTWYKRPQGWFDCARKMLDPNRRRSDLALQISTGAYAEGSSYYRYAADMYLPFFFAHARFNSGQGSFLNNPKVIKAARWLVDCRLPDGRRPAIDNSPVVKDTTIAFFLSRAAGAKPAANEQRLFLWDFQQAGQPGMTGRRSVNLMAAYDPTPSQLSSVSAPSITPTRILPKEGQAVLRNGWDQDDSTTVVNAEHGDARKRGAGHESVDNGHFTHFAHGDFITISPGYAGFSRVTETNQAQHHSIILVNGKGPKPPKKPLIGDYRARGCDAFIRQSARTQSGAQVNAVEVTTRYEKTDIRRTVIQVADRYLLVEDHCKSRRKRSFTSQIHPNAGQAKSRPLSVSGNTVRFQTNRQSVNVCVGCTANESVSTSTRGEFDAFGENPRGHDVIEFKARGKQVTFLTAIATQSSGQPQVTALNVKNGASALVVRSGNRVDVIVSNPSRKNIKVPASAHSPKFNTRRELIIMSFVGGQSQGQVLYQVG